VNEMRRNQKHFASSQRFQHQRFSSSAGTNQLGCTYSVQPEFVVHSVLDLIDVQVQDEPNYSVDTEASRHIRK